MVLRSCSIVRAAMHMYCEANQSIVERRAVVAPVRLGHSIYVVGHANGGLHSIPHVRGSRTWIYAAPEGYSMSFFSEWHVCQG